MRKLSPIRSRDSSGLVVRWLIFILASVTLLTGFVSVYALYRTAFEQQRARLEETAKSRARLLEAVARFDARYSQQVFPGGGFAATIQQISEAHREFEGFGETGEFTLAKLDGKRIVFLLSHRHRSLSTPTPLPLHSDWAVPMRRALLGESGTVTGLDYRGVRVLAAYEPVAELDLGLVAKIDLSEIRAPFVRTALLVTALALVLIIVGAALFRRTSRPLIDSAIHNAARYRDIFETSPVAIWEVDVSGVRGALERLREEGVADFRRYFDQHPEFVRETTRAVEVLDVNHYAVAMHAARSKGHLLRSIRRVFPPEAFDTFRDALVAMAEGVPHYEASSVLRTLGGDRRHTVLSLDFPEDESGILLVSHMNMTRLIEAEELQEKTRAQLLQSQKMEAVGLLAGGISHDFNNLLTVITGYSELVQKDLGPDHPRFADQQAVLHAAAKAARLVRQLLAFSRRQVLQPQVLDLNAIVADVEVLLRRTIGEDIQLVTRPAWDLDRVKLDPGQIEQVLMNLAVNARDAMPEGGRLTIETANIEVEDDGVNGHDSIRPGCYVTLTVSDGGIGMDEETCRRIFEPFFTTKDPGQGTGLGLSTVYGIVKQSGGFIQVQSEPGNGTIFTVYVPRTEEEGEAVGLARAMAAGKDGSETILLVEDDRAVREFATRALEENRYSVLAVPDSAVAVRAYKENAGIVDLVVTDLVLPGASGVELVEQLVESEPDIRVLYISGYVDERIFDGGEMHRQMDFLAKPFSAEELLSKVREILDKKEPAGHEPGTRAGDRA